MIISILDHIYSKDVCNGQVIFAYQGQGEIELDLMVHPDSLNSPNLH